VSCSSAMRRTRHRPTWPRCVPGAGCRASRAFIEDALVAYEFVRTRAQVPVDRIVIYGWSLGSAVAVDLASRVPEAAVILEGAPASVVVIGQQQYPLFPIRLIMAQPVRVDSKDRPNQGPAAVPPQPRRHRDSDRRGPPSLRGGARAEDVRGSPWWTHLRERDDYRRQTSGRDSRGFWLVSMTGLVRTSMNVLHFR
jgi:pimeloyl-ACP methyl ester carboxylesterase